MKRYLTRGEQTASMGRSHPAQDADTWECLRGVVKLTCQTARVKDTDCQTASGAERYGFASVRAEATPGAVPLTSEGVIRGANTLHRDIVRLV